MRKLASGISILLLLGLAAGLVLNSRQVADYLSFRNYQPTEQISAMATRSGMSDGGRYHFYLGRPVVTDSGVFNDLCQRKEKSNPILGCYVPTDSRIYIYDVEDLDLDGINEVTAAHEMLHVVYDRLSQSERDRLGPKLEAAYERLATEDLTSRLEYYKNTSPGSRSNELHSILATEFRDLGPDLEDYYAKYFSDRQAVVGLYEGYSEKFFALQRESIELSERLEAERADIETRSAQYEADVARLNADIEAFNRRADSGYFSSESHFYAERSVLMARSNELSARQAGLSQMIDTHNREVDRLNSMGEKIEKYNKSIDSFEGMN